MAATYTQRQYEESEAVKKLREQAEAYAAQKPAAYTSKWQDQLDSAMDGLLNRKDFQYDVNGDALYQQYKDRYVNLGQQAMMDTMGQAAKLTGGYGNSNAQMVGQQAYQNYMLGLADKVPEMYQMAYDRYNQQGQDLYNKYGLLNAQDQADYSRYMDSYNQYLTERDYLAGLYDAERAYDYGMYRDTVSDDQWKAQFDEDLRRYELQHGGSVSSGGGGSSGGSGGGVVDVLKSQLGAEANYGDGFDGVQTLVYGATSKAMQEGIIQNAYDQGIITKAGAEVLSKKVGNTKYVK